jgi:flavodoxin
MYLCNLFLLFLLATACSSQVENSMVDKASITNPEKVLIVYLSRTHNTKAVAKMIHNHMGGKLVALELKNSYPDNYKATVDQVAQENAAGFLPPLETVIDSMEKYYVVFVGFPTWGMQLPPPMKSFLKQYDLSGKTIVPFNTNAGYGIGSSFETVKALCPNSQILEGFSTKGGIERDGVLYVMEGEKRKAVETEVRKWLQRLTLIKEIP